MDLTIVYGQLVCFVFSIIPQWLNISCNVGPNQYNHSYGHQGNSYDGYGHGHGHTRHGKSMGYAGIVLLKCNTNAHCLIKFYKGQWGVQSAQGWGEEAGCVIMVYGLAEAKFNCKTLFNLMCLLGNPIKVLYCSCNLHHGKTVYR